MSIGANISVITVGAILTFATNIRAAGISVEAVGTVLMFVGAISLALQFAALAKQRRLTAEQATPPDETVLIRRPTAYGGTTAAPVPPEASPYQYPGQSATDEW